jgi:uncharacterized protein (UPF0333 family)
MNKFKRLLKENRGQISLEFIIILGVVILVALTVGIFLKQSSAKNVQTAQSYQRSFEAN